MKRVWSVLLMGLATSLAGAAPLLPGGGPDAIHTVLKSLSDFEFNPILEF